MFESSLLFRWSNQFNVRRQAIIWTIRKRRDYVYRIWHYKVFSIKKCCEENSLHYDDFIMGAIASHINSLTIVYSTVYSGADQSKHQSSASRAFVWGIHWGPVNSPHKWPVTRKMFPFDDVIMDGPNYQLYDARLWWGHDLSSTVHPRHEIKSLSSS